MGDDAGVKTTRGTIGEHAEGPVTLWNEVGSRGLDTWFELTAEHAMADGTGGEPGGIYVHFSAVEYYLATLEGEEAHEDQEGYSYAWLRYMVRRLRAREEG